MHSRSEIFIFLLSIVGTTSMFFIVNYEAYLLCPPLARGCSRWWPECSPRGPSGPRPTPGWLRKRPPQVQEAPDVFIHTMFIGPRVLIAVAVRQDCIAPNRGRDTWMPVPIRIFHPPKLGHYGLPLPNENVPEREELAITDEVEQL